MCWAEDRLHRRKRQTWVSSPHKKEVAGTTMAAPPATKRAPAAMLTCSRTSKPRKLHPKPLPKQCLPRQKSPPRVKSLSLNQYRNLKAVKSSLFPSKKSTKTLQPQSRPKRSKFNQQLPSNPNTQPPRKNLRCSSSRSCRSPVTLSC